MAPKTLQVSESSRLAMCLAYSSSKPNPTHLPQPITLPHLVYCIICRSWHLNLHKFDSKRKPPIFRDTQAPNKAIESKHSCLSSSKNQWVIVQRESLWNAREFFAKTLYSFTSSSEGVAQCWQSGGRLAFNLVPSAAHHCGRIGYRLVAATVHIHTAQGILVDSCGRNRTRSAPRRYHLFNYYSLVISIVFFFFFRKLLCLQNMQMLTCRIHRNPPPDSIDSGGSNRSESNGRMAEKAAGDTSHPAIPQSLFTLLWHFSDLVTKVLKRIESSIFLTKNLSKSPSLSCQNLKKLPQKFRICLFFPKTFCSIFNFHFPISHFPLKYF